MQDADTKKLEQILVMLADMFATFGDRFDRIADQLSGLDNPPSTSRIYEVQFPSSSVCRHPEVSSGTASAEEIFQVRNAAKIFFVTAAGAVVAATIGVTVTKTGHLYIANAISFVVGIATGALIYSLSRTPFVR